MALSPGLRVVIVWLCLCHLGYGGNCMALSSGPGLRVVIVWLCLLGYGW